MFYDAKYMVTISPKLHQPKKSYYLDAVDTTIKNKETSKQSNTSQWEHTMSFH
jgi:hypothetical protein